MPRGAAITEGGETVVADEPIPEVEAELDSADHDGFEAFLHTVRAMVHGEPATPDVPVVDERTAAAEDELSDWLPGVWQVESAGERRRGGARRATRKSRRVAPQPVGQSSEQAGATAEGAESASNRRERRRRRRREAAQAIAVGVPAEEPEPAGSPLGAAGVTTVAPTRARRRRRRALRAVEAQAQAEPVAQASLDDVEVAEPDAVLADTATPGPRRSPVRPSRRDRAFARTIAKAVARGESGAPPGSPRLSPSTSPAWTPRCCRAGRDGGVRGVPAGCDAR